MMSGISYCKINMNENCTTVNGFFVRYSIKSGVFLEIVFDIQNEFHVAVFL